MIVVTFVDFREIADARLSVIPVVGTPRA